MHGPTNRTVCLQERLARACMCVFEVQERRLRALKRFGANRGSTSHVRQRRRHSVFERYRSAVQKREPESTEIMNYLNRQPKTRILFRCLRNKRPSLNKSRRSKNTPPPYLNVGVRPLKHDIDKNGRLFRTRIDPPPAPSRNIDIWCARLSICCAV